MISRRALSGLLMTLFGPSSVTGNTLMLSHCQGSCANVDLPMFDITTTRTMAAQAHPPHVVFGLLFVFALCAALLAGSAMAWPQSRHWLHSATFAFALAGSVYVIIDMDFPRLGLIRVDAFDKVLVELRRSME